MLRNPHTLTKDDTQVLLQINTSRCVWKYLLPVMMKATTRLRVTKFSHGGHSDIVKSKDVPVPCC